MSMTSGHVVIRERSKLEACMTCPLCNKLFVEATTISECLHTFCRKCIHQKIVDEELDCCPVCNTDLGVSPLEKLRADHSWEDLRAKIFPSDKKKVKAPADPDVQGITEKLLSAVIKEGCAPSDDSVLEITGKSFPSERRKVKAPAVSSAPLPARRKEKYLSSLDISTPQLSARTDMGGKRRYPTRRSFPQQEHEKKEESFQQRLKSPESLKVDAVYSRQNSTAGSSKQHLLKGVEDNAQPGDGRADLWQPLNRLMEAASNTSCDKLNMQLPVSKSVFPNAVNTEVHGNEDEFNPAPSGPVTLRKQRGRKRKPVVSEGLNIPAQSLVDANSRCERRFIPIWFSLIASNNQEGNAPLPQIPSCYLRVKDGSLPVSFIKKYLVKKLDRYITSEAEVEISLRGKPVDPTLQLHNLADLWSRMQPASERIEANVGSSAKECVMVVNYGRKLQLR